jgi:hypothetical protein
MKLSTIIAELFLIICLLIGLIGYVVKGTDEIVTALYAPQEINVEITAPEGYYP